MDMTPIGLTKTSDGRDRHAHIQVSEGKCTDDSAFFGYDKNMTKLSQCIRKSFADHIDA
jgi:hypothetical protein